MVSKKAPKTKITSILVIVFVFCASLFSFITSRYEASATATCTTSGSTVTCTEGTTVDAQVYEVLTVAITRPTTWASGSINTFLTNKIGVSVISNNPAGFTATMRTASAAPVLVNQIDSSSYIPTLFATATLADSTDSTGLFPANQWGYSVVNKNASAPSEYYAIASNGETPVQIAKTTVASNEVAKDVYFAAKADGSVASGTYVGNVVINVVSGIIDANNPVNPTDPIRPVDDVTNIDSSNIHNGGATVMSTVTSDTNTTTTTTSAFVDPAGATEKTISSINDGSSIAVGLAVAAGVAATAGVIFFIVAKRRREEEEEDDYYDDPKEY